MGVVVVSGSGDMRDVNLAYRLGANSFLIKPVDFDRFVQICQGPYGFWLWLSQAPEVVRPLYDLSNSPGPSQPFTIAG
jgi:hypothetical protein